jgi:hypothetical protein
MDQMKIIFELVTGVEPVTYPAQAGLLLILGYTNNLKKLFI